MKERAAIWKNIKDTGKRILKQKPLCYGFGAIMALYSLPLITEGQQESFEIFIRCNTSKLTVEVISNLTTTTDQTIWFTVTPVGRRDTRLLEKGEEGRLSFSKQYTDSFKPGGQYTTYPRNSLKIEEGKRFVFGMHYGDVNILGTPRLTETISKTERVISCSNLNQN